MTQTKENKKLNILIADDESDICFSLSTILELEGYNVCSVNNGRDAIKLVDEHSFDLAFVDIKMPDLNGIDTFRQIKTISPETKVVMMTAYAVDDLVKQAFEEGAYECVYKPLDINKIISMLADFNKKSFILVVDDDKSLCELLEERLKGYGFNVVCVSSGFSGLKLVQRRLPDIILLDVVMEKMDGIETYKNIKSILKNNCPITVLMSSYDVESKFSEAKKLGIAECLKKPLNINTLKQKIESLLSTRKTYKILIVDDDVYLTDSLKELLSSSGYEVEVAHDGREVVERIKREIYKIVILDVKLPDANGLKIYDEIKRYNVDTEVIFITGFNQDEKVEEIIRKNNYICLYKPFNPKYVIDVIESLKKA